LADLLPPPTQRSAHVKRRDVKVLSCPAEKAIYEIRHIRIPATLFSAFRAQQIVQSADLFKNDHSQSYCRNNHGNDDQDRRYKAAAFFLECAVDPYMDWMKDDRDHDGQKNRSPKRAGDQVTEIERQCSQSQ
jgi:hypothetical protein